MSTPLPPHLDPRGRHHRGSAARSGAGAGVRAGGGSLARPLGRVLGALLSVTLLVVAGYYWYVFRDINDNLSRISVSVGRAPSGSNDIDGKDQNILLVGNDDRSNMTVAEQHALHAKADGGSLATDTMMIVHVPADGSKATLISLPRDSWVHIKGYGMGKLNSAYADAYTAQPASAGLDAKRAAGANLLVSTIQNLTGLTINHYIQVDLIGFYRISNAIGGIPVNLCHNVNDTHAANVAAGLTGGSGLKLSKGHHVLKGAEALKFVRQRHFLPRGDLDRIRRQQYFLTAAFRRVASIGLVTEFRSLGNAVDRSVYVDPGLSLIGLMNQMQNLQANNISGKTIPTTESTLSDGTDILVVHPAKVKRFITNVINGPSLPAGAKTHRAKKHRAIDAHCIN